MSNLSNLGQTVLAAIGAIILSSTAIGAAVGPAHAVQAPSAVYNA
jgi:hypothetical protein